MKITKKLAAATVAGALCLAMPSMAFAADPVLEAVSPEQSAVTIKAQTCTLTVKGGYNVTVTTTNQVAANAKAAGVKSLANFEIKGDLVNGDKATLVFTGLDKNAKYTVYVQHTDGSVETLGFTTDAVGQGTIQVTKFSIFTLAGGNAAAAGKDGKTSPQTGMDLTAPIAGGVITLATAAGATFVLRKKIAE